MCQLLFCECCGKSIAELRKEIEEYGVPVREGSKQLKYGKHYLRENGDVDTTSIYMDYCCECGAKLQYEDYKLIYESHPWGSTTATETLIDGYKCHACGHESEV